MTALPLSDEMDEFFDFHHATNHPTTNYTHNSRGVYPQYNAPATPYDIDLILAQAASDDDSFNSLQHYDIEAVQNGAGFTAETVPNVQVDGAARFQGLSTWMAGAERPIEPCSSCLAHGLDCLILKEGGLGYSGMCTNCGSLGRQCSLSSGKVGDGLLLRSSPQAYQETMIKSMAENPAYAVNGYRAIGGNGSQNSRMVAPSQRDETSENSSKSGTRFSRETVRLLRNWLSLHHVHPYPTEEEKDDLQRKTGLTKVQITNWLANARRRGQVKPPRTSPPSPRLLSKPLSIIQKPLPSLKNMGPMERWKNSPPEHEPATVSAIAKAVTSSASTLASSQNSPHSYPRSEAGSGRSGTRASSISSRNSSRSSGRSFASAYSHHSRGSFGSFGKRGRRRRRHTSKLISNNVAGTLRQYQCTFCTETFKTKHDWQRHEKSLHLSLERWVCAPDLGKVAGKVDKCTFCGMMQPDNAHYEIHNHTNCKERPLEERTFYRKDHLRQHLRLVHNCQFLASTMDSWKISAPEVRSRCGFCGFVMNTWAARIDHLAEHFKAGKSMAEWKGDWGFEKNVLKLVENGMAPYLIHEKQMALAKTAKPSKTDAPEKSRYDYIKASLVAFANQRASLGLGVTDDGLRAEARRIYIGKFETDGDELDGGSLVSWFGEVIMCSDDALWLGDIQQRSAAEASARTGPKYTPLNINDKVAVEKHCELEKQLEEYVNAQVSLGLSPTDEELRVAACHILLEYDRKHSVVKSGTAAIWFCDQIMSSHSWLANFRRRASLPPSPGVERQESPGSRTAVDASIHNHQKFESDMASFVREQIALGITPTDADLQRQARLAITKVSDPFLQAIADDILWITRFKQKHGLSAARAHTPPRSRQPSSKPDQPRTKSKSRAMDDQLLRPPKRAMSGKARPQQQSGPRDTKFWQRLEIELSRFVASCMSANLPNPHVPTDEEIRRQARWIMYNDENSWNQTAADNPEWLIQLKHSIGIASPEESSRMSQKLTGVDISFGVTGHAHGILPTTLLHSNDSMSSGYASSNDWNPSAQSHPSTPEPVPQLAVTSVFSSWNLESNLAAYASGALAQGFCPSNDDLRAQARAITGLPVTAADDVLLLEKFRQIYGINYASATIQNDLDMPVHAHRISPGLQAQNRTQVNFSTGPMQSGYEAVDPALWGPGSGLGGPEHDFVIR